MNVRGFSAGDLELVQAALGEAMCESTARNLDLSLALMTKRTFAAAAAGERDTKRLTAAALGLLYPGSSVIGQADLELPS